MFNYASTIFKFVMKDKITSETKLLTISEEHCSETRWFPVFHIANSILHHFLISVLK
jgi:hypothetical protein